MCLEKGSLLFIAIISSVITYVLSQQWKQGPVRASAVVALIGAVSIMVFKEQLPVFYIQNIPLVVIGASFVGMSTTHTMHHLLQVGLAGLIFGIFYLFSSRYFHGFGGALGLSACMAVLISIAVMKLVKRFINPD